jgi:hypothetical protein
MRQAGYELLPSLAARQQANSIALGIMPTEFAIEAARPECLNMLGKLGSDRFSIGAFRLTAPYGVIRSGRLKCGA